MHTYIIYKYISSTVNKLLMWHNKRRLVSLGIRGEAHSRNLKLFGAGNPLKVSLRCFCRSTDLLLSYQPKM